MTRRIIWAGVLALNFMAYNAIAQTQPVQNQPNCTQTLRTARETYDQGRLHELPELVKGCLAKSEDANGFTAAERIETYRILTLAHIYLEEPAKADESLISLLHTDPFYQLNEQVDPVEFKNLYKKFRTNPIFRYGLRVGGNTNHINVIANHYMWAASRGRGTYKSRIGVQIGGIIEKDLDPKKRQRFISSAELMYSTYSFMYNNSDPLLVSDDGSETGKIEHTIAQSKMQLNLLVLYRLNKAKNVADKFIPYVGVGPSFNYLMTSTFEGNTNVDEEVTGPSFDTKMNYKPLTLGVTGVVGARFKLGSLYVSADVRLLYGFRNVVEKSNRLKWTPEDEKLIDFGYVDNDFSISQSMFNLGIVLPKFSPKKLIR